MSAPRPTLHLVDASVYVFRAYYSVPPDMHDSAGQPVHAVYGFLGFLLALLDQARPRHVAIAFDESLTGSYRNRIYPEYKANRELPPPDLDHQFRWCRRLVGLLGIEALAHGEFEADDLIGSVLARGRAHGCRAVIVTADKDLAQLIGADDQIWDFARNQRYGADGVHERMGVRPEQVADFLALTGDAIDNIPGVPGIGAKTAAALLAHFGTLDALLARLDELPFLRLRGAASLTAKLREHRELALLSRRLTQISLDAPCPEHPDELMPRAPDVAALDAAMDELGFGPLTRRRVRDYAARFAPAVPA